MKKSLTFDFGAQFVIVKKNPNKIKTLTTKRKEKKEEKNSENEWNLKKKSFCGHEKYVEF